MKIVQIAAEFAPIAKAGGLGEVILGLSRELTRQSHSVEVLLPKYSFIEPKSLHELKIDIADFRLQENGQQIPNTMWSATVEQCQLRLLEARHPAAYYHRSAIYGHDDDTARFLYFCRASLEYLKLKGEPIDILHLHDWHAAGCAPLLRECFSTLPIKKILLTIHNLEYQGKCAAPDLQAVGLDLSSHPTAAKNLKDPDPLYPQTINLLKGGILYSDAVNTVSPSHAKEIITPEFGFGLDPVLKKVKLSGILNGIDSKIWDPSKDPSLAATYGATDSLKKIVDGKRANKELIQKKFGLRCIDRPLVGVISRLVPQKGTDLILAAPSQTIESGGSFALLGSSPVADIRNQFDALKESCKSDPFVFLQYEYNEDLAHQLYAAFDFLLVPSLFEPCGLTQIIALHYGTVPIVRSTGGLKDTVFDCEDGKVPLDQRNGFVFREPTPQALHAALRRALALFRTDPATFQAMMQRAMRRDCSWEKPAQEYLKLYRKL